MYDVIARDFSVTANPLMDVELIEKGKGIVVEKVYSYEDEVLVTGNFYLKPIEIVILKKGIAYGEERKAKRFNPLSLCVGNASKWLQ
ncbi:MAG: hypothetical protein SOX11_03625 [Lachnospiraceae bacterium]|nr:hypothetical protein [Lachnospiraceae bacterium]